MRKIFFFTCEETINTSNRITIANDEGVGDVAIVEGDLDV